MNNSKGQLISSFCILTLIAWSSGEESPGRCNWHNPHFVSSLRRWNLFPQSWQTAISDSVVNDDVNFEGGKKKIHGLTSMVFIGKSVYCVLCQCKVSLKVWIIWIWTLKNYAGYIIHNICSNMAQILSVLSSTILSDLYTSSAQVA